MGKSPLPEHLNILLFITAISKLEKKKLKKKKAEKQVEKWALKFWKRYFLMFSRFFTKLCCKWFFEKFCGMFDPILGFLLSKNDFAPLNLKWNPRKFGTKLLLESYFLFALLKWIFGACRYFFGTCCFEMYLLCLSLWKCFFGGYRFENIFGAFLFENCFLFFFALKMIICFCCCENYFCLQSL